MGRNMIASILIRLRDLVSPGLGALQRRLVAVRDTASRIGAVGAVVGAISFMAPIQQAAAFDQRLRDIAVTAGQSGAEVQRSIAEMSRQFDTLALATGQRSSAVAEAAGVLIAAGMERGLIDRLMPTIARVATATNSSITDIATTAFTLSDTLRVGPEGMEAALAAMVMAGKEGRFELRAMAREFPALTAAAAALGLTGRTAVDSLAAALQVARRGAGSESEAANNLANFLNKLTSPETARNFREAGVDLERVLADAAARGINPIEAVVQKVREISGGNMFRVGELFGDVQVLNFLRPMLQGTEEYLRIREVAARATPDIIGTDFATQMEGLNRQLEVFNEHLSQLTGRVGVAFSRVLVSLTPVLVQIQRGLEILDERMPGTVDNLLTFAGGAVALTAALGAIGFAAPAVAGGFAIVTAALKLLLVPLGLIWTGIVALLGPWVAAAALIAAAAWLIWRNWEPISAFFSDLWGRLQTLFSAFAEWVDGWSAGAMTAYVNAVRAAWAPLGAFFAGLWAGITRFLGSDQMAEMQRIVAAGFGATASAATAAWAAVPSSFGELWSGLQAMFGAFGAWLDGWTAGAMTTAVAAIRAAWEPLGSFFGSLWDGIAQRFTAVWDTIRPAIEAAQRVLGGAQGAGANPAMQPEAQAGRRQAMGARGAAGGFYADPVLPPAQRVQGEIVVRAAPGTEVERAATNDRALPLTAAPNRGPMLGLP